MDCEIVTIEELKLVGKKQLMSFQNDHTFDLWKSFMKDKHQIKNGLGYDLYSLQFYQIDHFQNFKPENTFEKWAAVAVSDLNGIPDGMGSLVVMSAKFAVFNYKGNGSDATDFFKEIYTKWLPISGYELDNRPHFEILGPKFKINDPESEEKIYIPIRKKG